MTQEQQRSGLEPDGSKRKKNAVVFLGLLTVFAGVLLNKWSLEQLFASNGPITSALILVSIAIFQLFCLATGIWLLIKKPRLGISFLVQMTTIFILAAGVLYVGYGNLIALDVIDTTDQQYERTVLSEELTLVLTPKLKKLSKSVMNLSLPDHESHELFEKRVSVIDLADPNALSNPTEVSGSVSVQEWQFADAAQPFNWKDLRLWRPILDRVSYFERAEFKFKKLDFVNETLHDIEALVLFEGLARLESGKLNTISAKQVLRWRKEPKSSKDPASLWHIYDWRLTSFKTIESNGKLFSESLDDALPDESALATARDSNFEQLVRRFFREKEQFKKPRRDFKMGARNVALSVVDVDRDGFDDLYAVDRWGENMFFRNRGDGTFEEIAGELGLNFNDHTTAALFADFDNDGDTDLFVGGHSARSMYLENDGGRFIDRSHENFDTLLPYLVFSLSAVDYNSDGLLDIYISTGWGSPGGMGQVVAGGGVHRRMRQIETMANEYLDDEDATHVRNLMRSEEAHWFRNRPGPPNVLLKNIGNGKFAFPPEARQLRVYRPTLQAVWSDFDADGDPDVYLANDFGPNNLFRNDDGRFVDVTESTRTADVGFGMGVSWGDYDNDGWQDLYVTNMYSKAGQRITTSISRLDSRITQSARGNSLLHNVAGRFSRVSGMEPPAMMVEKGGWGWGSQFVDVDNDGYLDIYALSGGFTVPKEYDQGVDI